MSTPKTAKVPTAITHRSKLDLSCQHITTGNFMEFSVAKAMELVPSQSIKIDMTTFTRLAPMMVPTFGNADIHNRAFFVPFRTVMPNWNEFIEDTTYVSRDGTPVIPAVPTIYNSTFVSVLSDHSNATEILNDVYDETSNPDGVRYDFVKYTNGSPHYYKFNSKGKRIYKLLCSLGYRIYFADNNSTPLLHSALPLLCLVKVYTDWYWPSAYVDTPRANSILRWLKYDYPSSPFCENFSSASLSQVLNELDRVNYDSDYFVSAWDNPVAPNDSAYSDVTITDPTNSNPNYAIGQTNSTNGTPEINATSSITQYALDALKSVSDYMKRHQLAGARVLDRYLSRWGVQLPAAKLNRSLYISESLTKIQFGDVTSTSDTSGAQLGAYAGKGVGVNSDSSFVDFSTDEFGMLIIVSTIVPKTAYYQGQDRCSFHINRLDFYSPEFDNLGVQALATRELFMPVGELASDTDRASGINFDNAVFGFVPRYAEYKRGYDNMTGDYVLGSKNVGKEGWTLMRDVSPFFSGSIDMIDPRYEMIVHSQNFVEGVDADQYNRIFYVTDDVEDKFNIIHNFRIETNFPGKPLYDSYEFREEDKAAKVTIDVNGVRAN